MTDERRVREVFDAASELVGSARQAYLTGVCAGNEALLKRVERLLDGAEKPDLFLSAPTGEVEPAPRAGADPTVPGEQVGAIIGDYKLLAQLGEGGFGTVWLAEQQQPVVRRVALKIIKAGMDTRQVMARFEAERQALAMMDHPNIARVFEAGATGTGRPYFVMEQVQGEPITAYCDANHLDIPQRLELFSQVCLAVQHAHTKGVIHRDLKPSNVLVSTQDGRPHARIIDFGIAKATSARLTERTLFTEQKALLGTPEYMSPEQAAASLDIDTRTDIYSLGVLLYELLVGLPPFDPRSLRSAAYAEMQRIIRDVDPPRPSTRASRLTETLPSIAASRSIDVGRLMRLLRGELDWIVMKALEKDRARRYETASAFAADVRRYLVGEPVHAAPPSRAYQARKFITRHKGPVAAASLVAGTLVLGVAGTSIGLVRAEQNRRIAKANEAKAVKEAERAEREAERALAAERKAEQRAEELEQVAGFQAAMLRGIDVADAGLELAGDVRRRARSALAGQGVAEEEQAARSAAFAAQLQSLNFTDIAADLIDRTILQPAIKAVDDQFQQQPTVDASLRQTLADSYGALGRYEQAIALQQQALEHNRRALGDDSAETINSLLALGMWLELVGKHADAEEQYRKALESAQRSLGPEHPYTLDATNNVGTALMAQDRLDEAEPYLLEAWEKRRHILGPEHADTLASLINSANLRLEQGRTADAEALIEEAVQTCSRVLGMIHPYTLNAITHLGRLRSALGRPGEAEIYFRRALEGRRHVLGDQHPHTLRSIDTLAQNLVFQGKLAEAEPLCRESLEACARLFGDEHVATARAVLNLGALFQAQDRLEDAESCLRKGLQIYRRVLGDDDASTLTMVDALASLLWRRGRLEEAASLCGEALERRQRVLGPDHPDTLTSCIGMGVLLSQMGRYGEAQRYYVDAVAGLSRTLGPDHWRTGQARLGLGRVLTAEGEFESAEEQLVAAERIFSTITGLPARNHRPCIEALAALYSKWDLAQPGKGYDATASAWRARLPSTAPAN